jgi:hypothetical protein
MTDWLEGRTSISAEELSERLARTVSTIREVAPDHAADLLGRMIPVWATTPARQQMPTCEGV